MASFIASLHWFHNAHQEFATRVSPSGQTESVSKLIFYDVRICWNTVVMSSMQWHVTSICFRLSFSACLKCRLLWQGCCRASPIMGLHVTMARNCNAKFTVSKWFKMSEVRNVRKNYKELIESLHFYIDFMFVAYVACIAYLAFKQSLGLLAAQPQLSVHSNSHSNDMDWKWIEMVWKDVKSKHLQ